MLLMHVLHLHQDITIADSVELKLVDPLYSSLTDYMTGQMSTKMSSKVKVCIIMLLLALIL